MIILDTREKVVEFITDSNINSRGRVQKKVCDCIMLRDLEVTQKVFNLFTSVLKVRDLLLYNCSMTHIDNSTTHIRVIRSVRMVDCDLPRIGYVVNGGGNYKNSSLYIENCTGIVNIDFAGRINATTLINMDMYKLSLQTDTDLIRPVLQLFGTKIEQVLCRRGVGLDGFIVPENDSFKFVNSSVKEILSERDALCFAKSKGGGSTFSSLFGGSVGSISVNGGFIECSLNKVSFKNARVPKGYYVFFSKCDLKGADFREFNKVNRGNTDYTSLLFIDCTNTDKMQLPEGCSVEPGVGRCTPSIQEGRDYKVVEMPPTLNSTRHLLYSS